MRRKRERELHDQIYDLTTRLMLAEMWIDQLRKDAGYVKNEWGSWRKPEVFENGNAASRNVWVRQS